MRWFKEQRRNEKHERRIRSLTTCAVSSCLALLGMGVTSCSRDADQTRVPTPRLSPAPSDIAPPQTFGPTTTRDELPVGWLELTVRGSDYICEKVGLSDAKCERDFGSRPFSIISPGLYCSNVNSPSISCDTNWYPDELDEYQFITYRNADYVCDDTRFGYGNLDCFRYTSGDPARATGMYPDLYCSDGYSLDCNEEYYPSEEEGLEIVEIDGWTYVCEDDFAGRGSDCYEWDGSGSPRDVISILEADYYCNYRGECSPDDYP
jgi:hypothetical protein